MSHDFLVSCAIPPKVYKYSEAVVRLERERRSKEEGKRNQRDPD